jgi:hypothetical protein
MKGLAHGYQKIANKESNRVIWWNSGSIGSMIAVIIFGLIFILMHQGTFDWTTLVSRIVFVPNYLLCFKSLSSISLTSFLTPLPLPNRHKRTINTNKRHFLPHKSGCMNSKKNIIMIL